MTADTRGELIKVNADLDEIKTDVYYLKQKVDAIADQLTKKQRDAILEVLRSEPL